MRNNKEVKASALYLIGNIITKAIAFLTIPIFTRLLTTTEYGIVNTYTSWVNIATVVITLSLYNSFRAALADKGEDFESYCASAIRLSGVLFSISMVLATLAIVIVPSLRGIGWMIFACLVQAFGTFCVTAMSTKYMLQFQYSKRAVYMIVPNVLCAVLSIVLMYLHEENRYVWRILAYVVVYILFISTTFWTMRKEKTKTEYWKYAIAYSLPLVFHGLSLVILSSSDRIMITAISGAAESGVYSLVYNLGLISVAVSTSLEGIWLPWFISKFKNREIQIINEKAKYLIENITVVVIGVMLVAPEILQVMASEQYWSGKPIIFPVVVASYIMFLYDLAVNVEYQCKATKKIATNTMMAAAINVILNLILIPIFGAIAAAYTTVIAYFFSMLLHCHYAKRFAPGIFPFKKYIPYFLTVIVVAVLCEFIYGIEFAVVRWCAAIIIGGTYLLLMFRKKRFIALQIKMEKGKIKY